MKTKLLFLLLLTTVLLGANSLQSAEIIPIWNKVNEGGMIHDIEFLRGEDEFIMIAGIREKGEIQIIKTLTGEVVKSVPLPTANYFNQIEITPDSNRFVMTTDADQIYTAAIELRNISDFKIIKKLVIKMDKDSVDAKNQPYYYIFKDIVIDPIKPYIYAFITKTNHFNDDDVDRTWLRVYNYETMEEIKDLTPTGFQYEQMKCMDVSDDGRYLAVLNEGKSFLKIWDTEKFELITNKQLYDNSYNDPNDYLCEVSDIEFSHKNNDLIYLSGYFPQKDKSFYPEGVYKFSIKNNRSIKIELDKDYADGKLFLFNNENRILVYSGISLNFLNQNKNILEYYTTATLEYPFKEEGLYSEQYKLFIGYSSQVIGSLKYDSQGVSKINTIDEIVISPNPTNNFVTINLKCSEPIIDYQINNSSGILISQNTFANEDNNLRLDFTPYPSGVYFITINCNVPKTYKIIKEG